MRISFGDCELETELYELRRDGTLVPIEPLVFEVLVYLIERRERVISRRELLDSLWQGRVVSESTINSTIKAARAGIGDDGTGQRFIATVRGRGYRFVGAIDGQGTESERDAARLTSKPSRSTLAVMPFEHAKDNEDSAWTAAMLVQDLTVNLARIPGFVVVSRNSALRYAHSQIPANEIGRDLDATYLIQGSIRQVKASYRISVQLVQAATGRVLWAERASVSQSGLGGFEDTAVSQITARIEPELNRAELEILRLRRPADLGAWALYRRATAILGVKGWSEETFAEAAKLLRLAVTRDPSLAFAHAYHALLLAIGHLVGLVNDESWHAEAVLAAETALALDNQDSDVLGYVGCAYADMGDVRRGLELMRRAVELNPSNAQAHAGMGAAMLVLGQHEGVGAMRYGMSLSPRDSRLGIWGALLARYLLSLGRVAEAIEAAEHACRCDDKIFLPWLVLAVAESTAQRAERATFALEGARRIRPQLSQADLARFASPDELASLGQLCCL